MIVEIKKFNPPKVIQITLASFVLLLSQRDENLGNISIFNFSWLWASVWYFLKLIHSSKKYLISVSMYACIDNFPF